MQSETLAHEFARLVKEYHEGDDHTKPEAWNLLADYAVDNAAAITSALSDKQAGEPVAWLPADDAPRGVYALIKHRSGQLDLCYKTDNGEPFLETWRYAGTAKRGEQAPWPESYIPVSELRTSPPLSREGEDSAEAAQYWSTVEQLANCEDEISRLREILTRAEEYVIDGVTTAKAEAEMNAPYPARAPRYDAALAEVRQLYADIQAALAATRSGSATTSKDADHG